MDKLTKKGLDGTQLKTIALVLMVLDHIHYFFEFTGCIPTVFNMLGRLADSVSDLTGTMPVFTKKNMIRRNIPSLVYGMTSSA